MSQLSALQSCLDMNMNRVIAQVEAVAGNPDLQNFLSWRIAPGRAHAAWQWTHIAVTEELFACDRLVTAHERAKYKDYWDRFRGGSSPSDTDVPSFETILKMLKDAHETLRETLKTFTDEDLDTKTMSVRDNNQSLRMWIQIMIYHSAHHHGQVHALLNVFKGQKS